MLTTAIILIVSLIILVIVLSVILTRSKGTNTNTNTQVPACDLGDKEKYYGLIGTPYKICSAYDCPFKPIDCCSIIRKCNFSSLLGSSVCPVGVSCSCYLNDSNNLDSCSTVGTSTGRNYE